MAVQTSASILDTDDSYETTTFGKHILLVRAEEEAVSWWQAFKDLSLATEGKSYQKACYAITEHEIE